MDFLFGDALVDVLLGMLRTIFGNVALNSSDLTTSIQDYSASAYDAVQGIHQAVVMPVAAVVISMMAVLELARQATHIEADRDMGVKIIGATMFKLVLLVMVVQNVDLIISALNGMVDTLAVGISGHVQDTSALPNGSEMQDLEGVKAALQSATFFDRIGTMVILLIPWLLALALQVLVTVLVWLRFMELYILTAFAALPLSFFGNPDTKSIAIGYLRRYAAVALQTVVILLVFALWNLANLELIGGNALTTITEADSIGAWADENMLSMVIGTVALTALILSSQKIAKSLVGS